MTTEKQKTDRMKVIHCAVPVSAGRWDNRAGRMAYDVLVIGTGNAEKQQTRTVTMTLPRRSP